MKWKYSQARIQFLYHVQARTVPEKQKYFSSSKILPRSPMVLALQSNEVRGTGRYTNFTIYFFDRNAPARGCPFLTMRTTDAVVNPRLNHTHIIVSPPHSLCQYKWSPVLVSLKINRIFICNRDFCWELSRNSQCLYFFDLSTLPVELRRLGHTGSISLWSQLAWFSASALYLSRSLQESSWHGHLV